MTDTASEKVAAWHLHRRLYNWVIHFADTPHGERALFLLSFAESSFFPVPPDVLLAPLTLGAPKKWFRFALSCSIASVLGGIFGYIIGIFLWSMVGGFFHNYIPGFDRDTVVLTSGVELEGTVAKENVEPSVLHTELIYPITFYTQEGEEKVLTEQQVESVSVEPFTKVGSLYSEHDWKIVAIAGFTPLPYKVITITAGVFKINFLIFMIASALSRSARFFIVAGLFGWKGEAIRPFIEKYFNWLSLAFVVLLIGGFAVLKLLHH
ncbi:MAG: YqaA family protein [Planctomycetota bacterium]|jgi:membrane protein YqaA with SNARE-associated domain